MRLDRGAFEFRKMFLCAKCSTQRDEVWYDGNIELFSEITAMSSREVTREEAGVNVDRYLCYYHDPDNRKFGSVPQ